MLLLKYKIMDYDRLIDITDKLKLDDLNEYINNKIKKSLGSSDILLHGNIDDNLIKNLHDIYNSNTIFNNMDVNNDIYQRSIELGDK